VSSTVIKSITFLIIVLLGCSVFSYFSFAGDKDIDLTKATDTEINEYAKANPQKLKKKLGCEGTFDKNCFKNGATVEKTGDSYIIITKSGLRIPATKFLKSYTLNAQGNLEINNGGTKTTVTDVPKGATFSEGYITIGFKKIYLYGDFNGDVKITQKGTDVVVSAQGRDFTLSSKITDFYIKDNAVEVATSKSPKALFNLKDVKKLSFDDSTLGAGNGLSVTIDDWKVEMSIARVGMSNGNILSKNRLELGSVSAATISSQGHQFAISDANSVVLSLEKDLITLDRKGGSVRFSDDNVRYEHESEALTKVVFGGQDVKVHYTAEEKSIVRIMDKTNDKIFGYLKSEKTDDTVVLQFGKQAETSATCKSCEIKVLKDHAGATHIAEPGENSMQIVGSKITGITGKSIKIAGTDSKVDEYGYSLRAGKEGKPIAVSIGSEKGNFYLEGTELKQGSFYDGSFTASYAQIKESQKSEWTSNVYVRDGKYHYQLSKNSDKASFTWDKGTVTEKPPEPKYMDPKYAPPVTAESSISQDAEEKKKEGDSPDTTGSDSQDKTGSDSSDTTGSDSQDKAGDDAQSPSQSDKGTTTTDSAPSDSGKGGASTGSFAGTGYTESEIRLQKSRLIGTLMDNIFSDNNQFFEDASGKTRHITERERDAFEKALVDAIVSGKDTFSVSDRHLFSTDQATFSVSSVLKESGEDIGFGDLSHYARLPQKKESSVSTGASQTGATQTGSSSADKTPSTSSESSSNGQKSGESSQQSKGSEGAKADSEKDTSSETETGAGQTRSLSPRSSLGNVPAPLKGHSLLQPKEGVIVVTNEDIDSAGEKYFQHIKDTSLSRGKRKPGVSVPEKYLGTYVKHKPSGSVVLIFWMNDNNERVVEVALCKEIPGIDCSQKS
jgi:hypothetical protein